MFRTSAIKFNFNEKNSDGFSFFFFSFIVQTTKRDKKLIVNGICCVKYGYF